jgi:hypothetical protein
LKPIDVRRRIWVASSRRLTFRCELECKEVSNAARGAAARVSLCSSFIGSEPAWLTL